MHPDAALPSRAHEDDAGLDLSSAEDVIGKNRLISMALPADTVGKVCPRSSLAAKHGATVLNAPGILINHSPADYRIRGGDRIAHLVLAS